MKSKMVGTYLRRNVPLPLVGPNCILFSDPLSPRVVQSFLRMDLIIAFAVTNSASSMIRGSSYKAVRNERTYPYIAELPVSVRGGLDVELSRRIVQFHKTRHVQPRHGRTILTERQHYYRWCFSDLQMAHEFIKQFGGSLCEPDRKGS